MMFKRLSVFFLLSAALMTEAKPLTVAVASNFSPTLRTLIKPTQQWRNISIISASTGKLYHQISHQAPYHVFLSGDLPTVERLLEDQTIPEQAPVVFAYGRIALWVPNSTDKLDGLHRAQKKLVIANPRLAPFGLAAYQSLLADSLWYQHQPDLIKANSVAQAFHLIASGHAQSGIIAYSHALKRDLPPSELFLIPTDHHFPIEQTAVTFQPHPKAQAFIEWLRSQEVQSRLSGLGYDSP